MTDSITYQYFLSASVYEQSKIIRTRAVFLANREDSRSNFALYQIDAFYVEVAYQKSDGVLSKIGPFDHPALLAPYLSQIDISGLVHSVR